MSADLTVKQSTRDLYAEFCLTVERGCPVTALQTDITEMRVQISDGICHADLVIGGEDRHVEHVHVPVERECVGTVFDDFDCVPHIRAVSDSTLVMAVFLPDVGTLPGLVAALGEVCENIYIIRFVAMDREGTPPRLFETASLTEKECEALQLAVDIGYFDHNGVSLAEIADALDISEGAVSRRIKSAKATILAQLCGRADT